MIQNQQVSSILQYRYNGRVNNIGVTYIAYCFSEIPGIQNLDPTKEMEMLMEHLFIQDLNLLLLFAKKQIVQTIGD